MLRLCLITVDDGVERVAGILEISRVASDRRVLIGDYKIKKDGELVGELSDFEVRSGEWLLAEAALSSLYRGDLSPKVPVTTVGDVDKRYPRKRLKPYRRDGQCCGVTQKRERCSTVAAPGTHFCVGHAWQSVYD